MLRICLIRFVCLRLGGVNQMRMFLAVCFLLCLGLGFRFGFRSRFRFGYLLPVSFYPQLLGSFGSLVLDYYILDMLIKKQCDLVRNYYRHQPGFKDTFINQFLNRIQFLTDDQLSIQDKELLNRYVKQVPTTKKKRKEGKKRLQKMSFS